MRSSVQWIIWGHELGYVEALEDVVGDAMNYELMGFRLLKAEFIYEIMYLT